MNELYIEHKLVRNLSIKIFKIHCEKDDNFKINCKTQKHFKIQVYKTSLTIQ